MCDRDRDREDELTDGDDAILFVAGRSSGRQDEHGHVLKEYWFRLYISSSKYIGHIYTYISVSLSSPLCLYVHVCLYI